MKVIKVIGLLQIAKLFELLIPIVAIPVVIKNIGLSEFGVITKILACSAYCVMIGEWGFNTNLVSFLKLKRERTKILFLVFIDVIKIRVIYSLLVAIVMLTLVLFDCLDALIAIVITLWIIANIFQCRWYFQATDKLVSYTIVSMMSKLGTLWYVFFIMDENSIKESYLISLALPMLFVSFFCNLYAFRMLYTKCKVNLFSFCLDFKILFYEGWNLISSRVISNLFNPTIIYLTANLYSNEVVGILGIFQKIGTGVVAILTPINEVIYPRLAGLYVPNNSEYKKIFLYQLSALAAAFTLFLLFFNIIEDQVFSYFNIDSEIEIIVTFYIYSITILTNLMNMAFVNALVIKTRTRRISLISMTSVIIAIITFYFFTSRTSSGLILIALTYVIQQVLSLFFVILYYNRDKRFEYDIKLNKGAEDEK